jgi:hypothetical protein
MSFCATSVLNVWMIIGVTSNVSPICLSTNTWLNCSQQLSLLYYCLCLFYFRFNWLIYWCLTPTLAVFQLYRGVLSNGLLIQMCLQNYNCSFSIGPIFYEVKQSTHGKEAHIKSTDLLVLIWSKCLLFCMVVFHAS